MELLMAKGLMLGAIAFGSVVVGMFFLRFWLVTHDRFFVFFALAFFLDALSRVLMAVSAVSSEEHPLIYLVRLLSYGLIIAAIAYKNLKKKPSNGPGQVGGMQAG